MERLQSTELGEVQCKEGTIAIGSLGKEWKTARILNMYEWWLHEL